MKTLSRLALPYLFAFALTACGGTGGRKMASDSYEYVFEPGKTAQVVNGKAVAPRSAPKVVKLAIAAGNELQGKPYRYGGGHAKIHDWGYDCSGTVSYVLNRVGLMKGTNTSSGFKNYGVPGMGKWMTVYAKDGHTFLVIAGLRLDTGGGKNNESGPQWKPTRRNTKGFELRRPEGL